MAVTTMSDRAVDAHQRSIGLSGRDEAILDALKRGDNRTLQDHLDLNPGMVCLRDKYGMTPLHWVVNAAQAEMLLRHGANVNARSDYGSTPLHIAARCGRAGVVALLLDHGADVDAKDRISRTPLHLAAADGHIEIVGMLAAMSLDVNRRDCNGCTPLELAVRNGHHDIAVCMRVSGASL